jgi:hypothetical protein
VSEETRTSEEIQSERRGKMMRLLDLSPDKCSALLREVQKSFNPGEVDLTQFFCYYYGLPGFTCLPYGELVLRIGMSSKLWKPYKRRISEKIREVHEENNK